MAANGRILGRDREKVHNLITFPGIRIVALLRTYDGVVRPDTYRKATLAALIALGIIVVTGAAVRLTESGLGCTDWPNCAEGELVGDLSYHTMIEQGNRWFTGLVTLSVIIAVLGAYRRTPRRADLILWAWGLVVGVLGQIVLGGIVVLSHLNPWLVLGHFLLSMVLIWNAVVLHRRARWGEAALGHIPRRTPLVMHSRIVMGLTTAAIVAGTLVTGAGPHSGSHDGEAIERLPFDVPNIARVHGIVVAFLIVASILLLLRVRRARRARLIRDTTVLLGVLIAQAAVGYIQYFNGVPVLLVATHIALATILWIVVVNLNITITTEDSEHLDGCFDDLMATTT